MNKSKGLFILILSLISLSFAESNNCNKSISKTGYIYKVKVNIDENIMERALVKDRDNSIYYNPIYKKKAIIGYETLFIDKVEEKWLKKNNLNTEANGPLYEMLDQNETNDLLTDFSNVIMGKTDNETVEFLKGSKGSVMSGMLGNVASNAMGSNKISFYLPNKKLKKIKVSADEYYEIEMKFMFGGAKDYSIVMDKVKSEPFLKFKIKVSITASNKKGDELWVKEKEVKDFSSVFNSFDILEDKKGKFFKIKRIPRIFDKNNEEPIGDYLSLSKEEFRQCMKVALDMTMDKSN
ncbi:hypothetical protein BTO05_00920 [Winogradskyella sp. PC-19]|uniref:hypothetical protein n=1 Tax=unclassified Winogradskyella TaxID=2615021 RepID=UPI000B3C701C|nr:MULTISPECIES: hypothetical protein [unclassified Winogradskyella]ARV08268.1 hypothetical protein BTO05_00920 [Winogradskyella sp. PC-19]